MLLGRLSAKLSDIGFVGPEDPPDRFLVTSGFSLASQSKTVTKGEDARRENPKGNKEIWESREMS